MVLRFSLLQMAMATFPLCSIFRQSQKAIGRTPPPHRRKNLAGVTILLPRWRRRKSSYSSSYDGEDPDSIFIRRMLRVFMIRAYVYLLVVIQHTTYPPWSCTSRDINVSCGITVYERVHFLCLAGVGFGGRRSTSLSESSKSVKPPISKFSPSESFLVTATARLMVAFVELGVFLGGRPRGLLAVSPVATRTWGVFPGAGTTGIIGTESSIGSSPCASASMPSSSRSDSSSSIWGALPPWYLR